MEYSINPVDLTEIQFSKISLILFSLFLLLNMYNKLQRIPLVILYCIMEYTIPILVYCSHNSCCWPHGGNMDSEVLCECIFTLTVVPSFMSYYVFYVPRSCISSSRLVQTLMLQTCIWKMTGLNISLDIHCPDWDLFWFLSLPTDKWKASK
jgi:hypothetical protein